MTAHLGHDRFIINLEDQIRNRSLKKKSKDQKDPKKSLFTNLVFDPILSFDVENSIKSKQRTPKI